MPMHSMAGRLGRFDDYSHELARALQETVDGVKRGRQILSFLTINLKMSIS